MPLTLTVFHHSFNMTSCRCFFVVVNVPLLIVGVIHGDYNEQNLLVSKNEDKTQDSPYEEHDIVGVIDFGDMAETCYVYEVLV